MSKKDEIEESIWQFIDKQTAELSYFDYINLMYSIADDAKTRAIAAEEDQN